MPNYKVSGYAGEACDIRLMKGNSFLGYRESVSAGPYELIFELDSIENVDVIAIRTDGKIVGYGNITPISTGDSVNITSPGSSIEFVESGYAAYSGSTIYAYVTLGQAVDWDRAILYSSFLGSSAAMHRFGYVNITSSTTFRYNRYVTGANYGDTIQYKVVQYADGIIKSLQRGINRGHGSTAVGINTIDPDKSVMILSGFNVANDYGSFPYYYIVDSNTIYISHDYLAYVSWQVVEFE